MKRNYLSIVLPKGRFCRINPFSKRFCWTKSFIVQIVTKFMQNDEYSSNQSLFWKVDTSVILGIVWLYKFIYKRVAEPARKLLLQFSYRDIWKIETIFHIYIFIVFIECPTSIKNVFFFLLGSIVESWNECLSIFFCPPVLNSNRVLDKILLGTPSLAISSVPKTKNYILLYYPATIYDPLCFTSLRSLLKSAFSYRLCQSEPFRSLP